MCKIRLWTPQDRAFSRDIKEALLVPHLGASAMPRKVVAAGTDRSEGWYSRVLNFDEYDWLPDLVDLRKITNLTGNREPVRVLNHWMGEDALPTAPITPFELLAAAVESDSAFEAQLSRDLADKAFDRVEAQRLLPMAAARVANSQKALDFIRSIAEGR